VTNFGSQLNKQKAETIAFWGGFIMFMLLGACLEKSRHFVSRHSVWQEIITAIQFFSFLAWGLGRRLLLKVLGRLHCWRHGHELVVRRIDSQTLSCSCKNCNFFAKVQGAE
jgi:hypothetical protein